MDIGYTLRTLLSMTSAAAVMLTLLVAVENGLGRRSQHREGRPSAPVELLADAEESDH
jgi:hypothetical protein